MRNKLLRISLVLSALSLNALPSAYASLPTCHFGIVERAGVAVVKHFPQSIPALEYTVLVGIDAQKTHNGMPCVNFFAGKCDPTDPYSTSAAARETREETAEAIQISGNSLRGCPYAYSGDFKPNGGNTQGKNYIQLFFVRNDALSVTTITQAQVAAVNNHQLPHHLREVRATCALPLQDVLNAARAIAAYEAAGNFAAAQNDALYTLHTRGNGQGAGRMAVFLDPQYLRNLARDINNFVNICQNITNNNVQ